MKEYALLVVPLVVTVVVMTAFRTGTSPQSASNIRGEVKLMQEMVAANTGVAGVAQGAQQPSGTMGTATSTTQTPAAGATPPQAQVTKAMHGAEIAAGPFTQTQQQTGSIGASSVLPTTVGASHDHGTTPSVSAAAGASTTSSSSSSCSVTTTCSVTGNAVMGGLDFVQYFTTFKNSDGTYDTTQVGVLGSSDYSSTYSGFTYYFVSADNKALFDASPSSYVPAYGGYCGYALAEGTAYSKDCLGPSGNFGAWDIYEDKLYFFKSSAPQSKFVADPATIVAAGDAKWNEWFPEDTNSHMSTECYTNPNV